MPAGTLAESSIIRTVAAFPLRVADVKGTLAFRWRAQTFPMLVGKAEGNLKAAPGILATA